MWILIIGIVVVSFIIIFANGELKRSDVVKQTSEYDYYKQKKAYENSIYEENVKNEKSHIGANSSSSTQKLSSHEIRSYLPYMDSKLASMYRKAILDGQYSFSVGKRLIEQWEKNRILKKTAVSSTTTSSVVPKEFTNLTWWQLQQYNPVMSLDESADYLAEHLINESKLLTVKTSRLKEWEKQLVDYKKNEIDLQQTTDNNNKGIALEKEGNIASAIEVYEVNLKIGYPATHSYERLMKLYHKAGDITNEKRVLNLAIQAFTNVNEDEVMKFRKRLTKLNEDYVKSEMVLPQEATIYHSLNKPLGILYEETKLRFKEFDFYNSGEDRSNGFMNNSNKHEIWSIQNKFKKMISDAKEYEELGRLDKASEVYERLVFEQYYLPNPYDRLIKIYSRAKMKQDELRILEYSIAYFQSLRDKQAKYVLHLAQKYSKYDFANDRIANGQKITYYNGAFELYNPYPIIQKWQERLNKLIK